MLLPIENWLTTQELSREARELFAEAVTCYKASAHRAALLFSFLGLETVIRDRVVIAQPPLGISPGQWAQIQSQIQNDEEWEKVVGSAILQQKPAPIFIISDDLRQQFIYFRFRRNDCAHGKKNKIEASHVEVLWAFIQSNLPKFVVNGSEDGLLNKIRDHFDRTITPPGKDYSPLLEEIPHSVELKNMSDFLGKVQQIVQSSSSSLFSRPVREELDFYNRLFQLNNEDILKQLIRFLQADDTLLVSFLKAHPERTIFFADQPALIRSLWYEKLFKARTGQEWNVIVAMLRNRLIPEGEIQEAFGRILSQGVDLPTEENFIPLKDYGFFRELHRLAFRAELIDQFEWANRNSKHILFYVDKFDTDLDMAKALSKVFSRYYNPTRLQNDLDRYLQENNSKRESLILMLKNHNLDWPTYLRSLPKPTDAEAEESSTQPES